MISLGKPIEQTLGIGSLLLLAIACFLVLWPFLSALLWAAVIAFSTWPLYTWCERSSGGRAWLAAAMMMVLVVVVLVAPFAVILITLADSVSNLIATAGRIVEQGPPAPPFWVAGLPVVGESLATYWDRLAHNAPAFMTELQKLIGPATDVAMAGGAVLGVTLVQLGLSVFITFFFFRHGRQMASYLRVSAERIAGPRGLHLLIVVTETVKGVVYGLIGTALAQGMLASVGFRIAGIPQAVLLGFLTFVLSFVPGGPALVWASVALWLFAQGSMWWGIFVATWGLLVVSSIDNVLRPFLLSQTNSLPMLLGLFGFVGGILAFGFIGVFLGPTLLAVGYSLFLEWHAAEADERQPAGPA